MILGLFADENKANSSLPTCYQAGFTDNKTVKFGKHTYLIRILGWVLLNRLLKITRKAKMETYHDVNVHMCVYLV